jgi:hypothetical protein
MSKKTDKLKKIQVGEQEIFCLVESGFCTMIFFSHADPGLKVGETVLVQTRSDMKERKV